MRDCDSVRESRARRIPRGIEGCKDIRPLSVGASSLASKISDYAGDRKPRHSLATYSPTLPPCVICKIKYLQELHVNESRDTQTMAPTAVVEVDLKGQLPKIASGKVRDLFAVDENTLLFVTSDRISAYDVVMKNVSLAPNANQQHCYAGPTSKLRRPHPRE